MSEFKIHHHVSELFSLLGISKDAAERYTETLGQSVQHFINTQVSASSAVRILAENAPDPQAFLSKYDELKSRNVRDLDPLVVFLSGLVEDEEVRKAIESGSRSKMKEEGLSFTTVPSIVSEIEHAAETKLSKDQLNELRDRLLRESQVTHVPSEAMRAVERGEKKNILGPPTPSWLDNRPYHTLDFVQVEHRPDVGALGKVASTSQEHQLIEDLLSLMMGIEGMYITVQPPAKHYDAPEFTVDPSVEPSLSALVSRILPLCGHYSQLVRFVEDKSLYHHGLVNQALAAALTSLIKDYMLLVTQLEAQHQRWALTLHKLWFYVEKTMAVMDMLACITRIITKSEAHGGSVLSLLHDRTLSLTGCGQLQEVMVFLTQAAAVPYMNMLAKWLYRGIINDPYNEFMVVDRESSTEENEEQDLADDYWEKRYTIIPHNIPAFLQMHADVILRTGKYLNVIRQSDHSVVCPDQEELAYSIRDPSYTEVIERTYSFASKRLLELLMKEKDLMGRLRSVKHYFLLDQGDFVVQLMSLCEDELSKNIDDVLPTRLESLLELALRTSAANNDLYKDDIQCDLQPITLMNQMLRILSIETEDEREYYPQEERLQLSGLQGFSLGYRVTWPVSLVLDRKTIACYQMIFRHLFYCKHVERLLCRVWVSNKVAKSFPLSASRTYTAAFALRQRMLNFIQNIEYYMMFEVIERNWQTFINKMQKVENVDEVLAFHNDFLSGCLKDCMLTSPELLRMISKLTGICVNFANFIEESPEPAATTHEDSQSFEQTISRFELQFSGMIYTLMEKISEMGRDNYNDALVNVIYRLDFNAYYAKKHEHLRMATSPEASLEYISGPVSG
ncbi:gamma-tubulin complex component 2-like isoform X2 [Penaeus monodon]|uniref:gamma-tubulin complex component 2-like isoform X2 n=2 Tax=Penaeus monodon TaxID=6687 RepID=UPI0018A752E1|nr:gamma-tubulin complex component 2-like isoform X2 [Penaeus monodon]